MNNRIFASHAKRVTILVLLTVIVWLLCLIYFSDASQNYASDVKYILTSSGESAG